MAREHLRNPALIGMALVVLATSCCSVSQPTEKLPPTVAAATATPAALAAATTPTKDTPRPTVATITPTATPEPLEVIQLTLNPELLALFSPLLPREVPVAKAVVEANNPGVVLLTPEGGPEQRFVQFEMPGTTWVSGNLNLPVYAETSRYQPSFNSPDFPFMMGWVDSDGNWLYHIPLQSAQGLEGKAPVVYQRDDRLCQGSVDLQTGQIDPGSERDYWQPLPAGATKAVMAKYGDAVYVTFWDGNGNQIGQRIKVCDLPAEPTPVPTTAPTVKATAAPQGISVSVEGNFEGARILVDQSRLNQAKDYFFGEMFGKTSGRVEHVLIPHYEAGAPDYHNVSVTLNLSRISVIYHDFGKMTPEEERMSQEGMMLINPQHKARYDVGKEGELVIDIFMTRSSNEAVYAANLAVALEKWRIGFKNELLSSPAFAEFFRILVGDCPLDMGGKRENFTPCIKVIIE